MTNITLRRADRKDLPSILHLFTTTIATSCRDDYNEEQIKAWQSTSQNHERWLKAIDEQYFVLAASQNDIVGFSSLDHGSYIDFMFVDHAHAGQGIAKLLFEALKKQAIEEKTQVLTVNASLTALPFFQRMGFKIIEEHNPVINGISFTNYFMKKSL